MMIQKLTDTDPVFDAANTINFQLGTISMENLGIAFVNSFVVSTLDHDKLSSEHEIQNFRESDPA